MINVYQNISNDIIYTASELDTATSSTYVLSLKSYENQETYGITISDTSLYKERYNKSLIYPTSILTSYIISTSSTIDTDEIIILDNDIIVPTGMTLSVNGSIIMTGTYSGSIINANNISIVSEIEDYYMINDISITTNLKAGFYDYSIKNINNSILELGIFRIISTETEVTDNYTPDIDEDDVYIPD